MRVVRFTANTVVVDDSDDELRVERLTIGLSDEEVEEL